MSGKKYEIDMCNGPLLSKILIYAIPLIASGILQLATGGKALTEKYKKQLRDSFVSKLKETREESCSNYATNISKFIY